MRNSKILIEAILVAALAAACAAPDLGASKKALDLVQVDVAGPDALNVGDVQQYSATGTLDDQSTVELTHGVTWASSDESVATVDSGDNAGQVTAVGPGQVTISASSDGGAAGTFTITVNDPSAVSDPKAPQPDGIPGGGSESVPSLSQSGCLRTPARPGADLEFSLVEVSPPVGTGRFDCRAKA